MAFDTQAPPRTTPVTTLKPDPMTGLEIDSHLISEQWVQWFYHIVDKLDLTPRMLGTISTGGGQHASIGVTPLLTVPGDGLYRISYYVGNKSAGTGTSSLALTLYWVEGGLNRQQTGPTMDKNTPYQSNSVLVHADGGTPISFSTNYASNGNPPMQYSLDVIVEAVVS